MNRNGGMPRPKFSLGQVVATPAALTALESTGETPQDFLARHWQGDWGDPVPEDVDANERALVENRRIFSAHNLADGSRLLTCRQFRRRRCVPCPHGYKAGTCVCNVQGVCPLGRLPAPFVAAV